MNEPKTGFRIIENHRMLGVGIGHIVNHGEKMMASAGVVKVVEVEQGKEIPLLLSGLEVSELQNLYSAIGNYLSEKRALPQDGQFEAQGKHLEDMRTIVFKQLKIEK